jgi:hypothetical protein
MIHVLPLIISLPERLIIVTGNLSVRRPGCLLSALQRYPSQTLTYPSWEQARRHHQNRTHVL